MPIDDLDGGGRRSVQSLSPSHPAPVWSGHGDDQAINWLRALASSPRLQHMRLDPRASQRRG